MSESSDDTHLNEVAAPKFAVDCHIEQREIAMVLDQFETHSDRPDVPWLERVLLIGNTARVPREAQALRA